MEDPSVDDLTTEDASIVRDVTIALCYTVLAMLYS